MNPISYADSTGAQLGALTLNFIDTRSQLTAAERVLSTQLDPYLFLRESYQQNRINDLFDGNPPESELDEFDEFFDEHEEGDEQ